MLRPSSASASGTRNQVCRFSPPDMANQKNHHFVPQFYLKQFSGDGRSVASLHLASGRIIPRSSIRDQCSKDYLYGKDPELEKALSSVEGETAQIFRNALTTGQLPTDRSRSRVRLLEFLALQRGRTLGAGYDFNQMVRMLGKYLIPRMGANQFPEETLQNIELTHQDPVLASLITMSKMTPLLSDLTQALVINRTEIGFLTSDDPAVFYNQYLESAVVEGLGAQSVGLQVFLPISPTHLLLLYDSSVYGVGKGGSPVSFSDVEDVRQINRLVTAHARDVVFFDSRRTPEEEVLQTAASIRGLRVDARMEVRVMEPAAPGPNPTRWVPAKKHSMKAWAEQVDAGKSRELITSAPTGPKTQLNLRFLKIRRRARKRYVEVSQSPGLTRSPDLVRAFELIRNQRA